MFIPPAAVCLSCLVGCSELAQITGIAAILRFPMPDIEQIEADDLEADRIRLAAEEAAKA